MIYTTVGPSISRSVILAFEQITEKYALRMHQRPAGLFGHIKDKVSQVNHISQSFFEAQGLIVGLMGLLAVMSLGLIRV